MENLEDSKESIQEESTDIFVFDKVKPNNSPDKYDFSKADVLGSDTKDKELNLRDEFGFSNYNQDDVEMKSREEKQKIYKQISTIAIETQSKVC